MGMRPLSETQAARGSKQPRSKLWGIISGRVLHGGCLSWPKTLIRSGISREGRNRFLLPTFSEDHISPFTSERRRRQATAVWRTGVDTQSLSSDACKGRYRAIKWVPQSRRT